MKKELSKVVNNGPMLNAYPDSIGGALKDILCFLQEPDLTDVFSSFYILPSIFNTDLDRGFSVIDYELNDLYASKEDLSTLKELKIDLKLDFILNHASVLSKPFQDILQKGEESEYADFFINWNKFWEGHGNMTEEGYIQPEKELIQNMFFRKPGLPILMVRIPDGTNVPYWNTFYQEIKYPKLDAQDIMKIANIQYQAAFKLANHINKYLKEGKKVSEIPFDTFEAYQTNIIEYLEANRKYLGQMDLNIKSPLVWEFYENTLKTLSAYGAKIVRLDAFAYAPKEPGEKNFLNDPGTFELLDKVQKLADQYNLTLLPEIHASYGEKIYELLAQKGYMTYDFFLPGLIIDALEHADGSKLKDWAEELIEKKIQVVNMLGCHDGIPLLDLKGMIPEEQIEKLIDTIVKRGGYVKNLHGQKNVYYQVNATYYSALGEDDRKMVLARALQLFMPGKPQIWYLDLFAGKNDHKAVEEAGAGGHKEINRSNLTLEEVKSKLSLPIVQKQIEMLKFRNQFLAFDIKAQIIVNTNESKLDIIWKNGDYKALLKANLKTMDFEMLGFDKTENITFSMRNM